MSVGATIRVAPVAGEGAASAPAEAADAAEIFGEIISCLAVPAPETAEPGLALENIAGEPGRTPAGGPEAPVPQSPLEAIEQLLSLAAGAAPYVDPASAGKSDGEVPPRSDAAAEAGEELPAALEIPSALISLPTLGQAPSASTASAGNEPPTFDPATPPALAPRSSDPFGGASSVAFLEVAAKGSGEQLKIEQPGSRADPGEGSSRSTQAPRLAALPPVSDLGRSVAEAFGRTGELAAGASDQPLPAPSRIAELAASLLPRKLHPRVNSAAAEPIASAPPVAGGIAAFDPSPASPLIGDVPRTVSLELAGSDAALPAESRELAVERQLDLAQDGEWLDQLASDISEAAAGEGKSLRFRLNPETLGTLRVEIAQDRQGAAIRLTADTEAARSVIADAQPRLLAEARAHGLRISEAHVDLGGQNASGDPRRQRSDFEEAPLRTARSLHEEAEGDGKPTPRRSERYA